MRVLITGSNGFIGKNLLLHLKERKDIEVVTFDRNDHIDDLIKSLSGIDFIFHLAGINRPKDPKEYQSGNVGLTDHLARSIAYSKCKAPIIYTSSIQADLDNDYGKSKRAAEEVLISLRDKYEIPVYIYRLPNVFGKWSRPKYNSVVATFCHNIANDIPVEIHDRDSLLNLVYIDDVIDTFVNQMDGINQVNVDQVKNPYYEVDQKYKTTVGKLADQLYQFKKSRINLQTENVGGGLVRALYSTYLSYLPKESFKYEIPSHQDSRGTFVEMLKTNDAGQFSYFTAHPGITRGGHYHHTKTEKFLVIKGTAKFKFKNMVSGECHEVITNGNEPQIVETVPGWSHDITNIGEDELIVMLWANEIFDRQRPDTYSCQLTHSA
ncbi:NAD-dependent epimerase/dehydratase family protein [Sansalvadorimonas sp. 2012CJ34-2]|uniref:NAD-dependent epimerase/dehydratase family protein n=1 Tax=Parendozoicomonas callyspongiae TaxID=2942213 RepID=A0ABT0PKX5_9GAMM|nr:NAD-dependent epimerase/dehydratase family protein [Sansalvadorimonas sp. 2012CJ34-2]MCL6272045.1 NAD-dependent epimerase/dehydratase family protein [Sansalvadorimonas sp. 2012CJ34-2]